MALIADFTIITDTREQKPWKFVSPTVRTTLDAGDYSLVGLEKRVRIERKGSANEFAGNCGKDWPRFHDALRKLARYRHRSIICEFEMRDIYAENWRGGMTTDSVLSRLSYITLELQIPVLMAGKRGRDLCERMLLKYFNRHRRGTRR